MRTGRFGGAQRLALLRHALADEPHRLAAAERALLRPRAAAPATAARAIAPGDADDDAAPVPYEPCTDDFATSFLNRLDVQQAIHVNGGPARNGSTAVLWSECSRAIHYNRTDSRTPMMPLYSYLLNSSNGFGLDVLVYSGDDDMVCATEGSQEWIYDLGFPTDPTRAWHSWHYDDATFGRQAAGYIVRRLL